MFDVVRATVPKMNLASRGRGWAQRTDLWPSAGAQGKVAWRRRKHGRANGRAAGGWLGRSNQIALRRRCKALHLLRTPPAVQDDVFVSKEEIAVDVKEELTKSMAGFGFAIIKT